MEDCIFCKIARNEVPSQKVYIDDNAIAFLDINPANPGHALVAPKRHYENMHDISDAELAKTMSAVKAVAEMLMAKMNAEGINVVQNNGRAAGQLVNHIHFHVIPRYKNDSVIITYQRMHMTDSQLADIKKTMTGTEGMEL